ncbi:MAG: putative transcriptional regulatory protein [Elusimicrobia bacterium]|nr:putative transcriptional regulatory protein [Elusimicrobiota bacterium]
MSGHSRWAGIKHKKAIIDSKRGKVFTRIAREITIAAKQGGGKPESNPRLRTAIDAARAANMPQDNVKRAIQRGTGEIPGMEFVETTYEGYGPGGVAIFIEATTDNKNRTTAEIRHIFSEHGGSLGESGSVGWIFEPKGYITILKSSADEEKLTNLAIECGADDIKTDDEEVFEVFTSPADFESIKSKLTEAKVPLASAEVSLIPKNTVPLEGDVAKRCLDLMDTLESHDDVKTANANFEISKETMERASS